MERGAAAPDDCQTKTEEKHKFLSALVEEEQAGRNYRCVKNNLGKAPVVRTSCEVICSQETEKHKLGKASILENNKL